MIKLQVNGTMQIDAEIAGVYTTSRQADQDGFVLTAADPIMEIRQVNLRFGADGLSADAECVFSHTIGTVDKKDSITFYLTPAVLGGAILPTAYMTSLVGDNPGADEWLSTVIKAISPGIVGTLTDGVTATPI